MSDTEKVCTRLSEHDPHDGCPGIAGFSPPVAPDPNADLIGLRIKAPARGITMVVTGTPWYGGQYVDVDLVDQDGKVVGKSGMTSAMARAARAAKVS